MKVLLKGGPVLIKVGTSALALLAQHWFFAADSTAPVPWVTRLPSVAEARGPCAEGTLVGVMCAPGALACIRSLAQLRSVQQLLNFS